MKKISILIAVILSTQIAKSQTEASMFKLGVSIDSVSGCSSCEAMSVIFDRGGIKRGLRCSIRGILFDIVYSDDRKIIFYSTEDSAFLIRNYRYLTKEKNTMDSIKKEKIIFTDLFQGAYINLPDGWRLGFIERDIITENDRKSLKENAVPFYLYKTSLLTEFPQKEDRFLKKRKPLTPINQ